MIGQLAVLGIGIVSGVAALATLVVLAWRVRSPLLFRPVVWFSKRFVNPRQLQAAGRPGAQTGIVRHVGRRSGTRYQTPVDIVVDGDGYLIALPYGTRTNWLRNVLEAGRAELVHDGQVIEVDRPELVPLATVATRFTGSDLPMFRLLHVDTALRLRRAAASGGDRLRAA